MSEGTDLPPSDLKLPQVATANPPQLTRRAQPTSSLEETTEESSPAVTIRSHDVVSDSKAARDLRQTVRPDVPTEIQWQPASNRSLLSQCETSTARSERVAHRSRYELPRSLPVHSIPREPDSVRTVPAVPEALHSHPKPYQLLLAAVLGGAIALALAAIHTHPAAPRRTTHAVTPNATPNAAMSSR
jgi:hypothetical protein